VKPGTFITFEGADGVGKSTHVKMLAKVLENQGIKVVVTREPGGTEGAERIRALLKEGDKDTWRPISEVLLLYAGRYDHVEKVIKPALARGEWVICDRFTDSTLAYQCFAHELPLGLVKGIDQLVLDGFEPDITFFMDNDAEDSFKRVEKRAIESGNPDAMDRVEKLGVDFQKRLLEGYRALAAKHDRFETIDARADKLPVHQAICQALGRRTGIDLTPLDAPIKPDDQGSF
tara:strand:- start:19602 stop:20297 length:696 start_codon:yes stop_codon:yes gene_type:complete